SLLTLLRDWGSPQSCSAIRRITGQQPHLTWLKWTLAEAEATTRRRTWLPPEPAAILALARSHDRRLVLNAGHLLDTIVESLERFQRRLFDETPLAPFLWDKQAGGKWRPKDENYLSDLVKHH